MTCKTILEGLKQDFVSWSCQKHPACSAIELKRRDAAVQTRQAFLRRYPFHKGKSAIGRTLTNAENIQEFLVWLIYRLRPLGGIQAVIPGPSASRAARDIDRFHQFLLFAATGDMTAGETVNAWMDGEWRDERLIAKKIVATYHPDQIVPAFRRADMEHFVRRLGRNRDRDRLCQTRFGMRYDHLNRGQQLDVLNEILLESKRHHPELDKEDNVYFMYCLYAGRLRPPGMPEWHGHVGSRYARQKTGPSKRNAGARRADPTAEVAEVQTGIRQGQRFCDSPQARRAIELRASELATHYLESHGWGVNDVSVQNLGYDLHCNRRGEELMVEVKGTTADLGQILLTHNEVAHARERYPRVALLVVSRIRLAQTGTGDVEASGGEVHYINPWAVDDGSLTPLAYKYVLPPTV